MIPAWRDGTVAVIPPVVQILVSVYTIPLPSRLGEIPVLNQTNDRALLFYSCAISVKSLSTNTKYDAYIMVTFLYLLHVYA